MTGSADASPDGRPLETRLVLQHRVRNLFATIRVISSRTAETKRDPDEFHRHFVGRLDAIGRAEAARLAAMDDKIDVDFVVAEEMLAHGAQEGEEFLLSGPGVKIADDAIPVFWLAIHELVVNSVKFGALFSRAAPIEIGWEVDGSAAMVRLEWREQTRADMQPVLPGLGTQVIEQTLAYQIGATGMLQVATDTVRCRLDLPLRDGVIRSR